MAPLPATAPPSLNHASCGSSLHTHMGPVCTFAFPLALVNFSLHTPPAPQAVLVSPRYLSSRASAHLPFPLPPLNCPPEQTELFIQATAYKAMMSPAWQEQASGTILQWPVVLKVLQLTTNLSPAQTLMATCPCRTCTLLYCCVLGCIAELW